MFLFFFYQPAGTSIYAFRTGFLQPSRNNNTAHLPLQSSRPFQEEEIVSFESRSIHQLASFPSIRLALVAQRATTPSAHENLVRITPSNESAQNPTTGIALIVFRHCRENEY